MGINPVHVCSCSNRPQRVHLEIPLHGGLGSQHMGVEGHNLPSVAREL